MEDVFVILGKVGSLCEYILKITGSRAVRLGIKGICNAQIPPENDEICSSGQGYRLTFERNTASFNKSCVLKNYQSKGVAGAARDVEAVERPNSTFDVCSILKLFSTNQSRQGNIYRTRYYYR